MKTIRKNKHLKKQAKPLGQKTANRRQRAVDRLIQKSKVKILNFLIVIVLAGVPFCLGKYIEFNTPGPYDSGAYVYSAKHILDGAKIGIDEKPSASIGTLLVNMLGVWLFGFNETGPELIQTILQATALVLMFITMRKLFGNLAAGVGVIMASVYLSAPLIAKFGNVKEQYMIACAVMGISCFVLYQLGGANTPRRGGKWWLIALAAGLLVWAPLFKPTGFSAIGAVGLFVLVGPLLGHTSWKQTGTNILLMLAAAIISIMPVCLWLAAIKAPIAYWPYSFIYKPIVSSFSSSDADVGRGTEDEGQKEETRNSSPKARLGSRLAGILPGYIRESWQALSWQQKKDAALRVLRYYKLLILPILLATGSIVAFLLRGASAVRRIAYCVQRSAFSVQDRFVLLFATWWLLDMAFIWVSPRSYEQYYLPLNASAAMLGGYLIALYSDKLTRTINKGPWILAGVIGLICMIAMSWHIFLGIETSPHSGQSYGQKRRGYVQRLSEVSQRRRLNLKGYWEIVGEYIRAASDDDDKIYVWGWVPGIYVKAQRLAPVPKAFTSEMHIKSPQVLSKMVNELLAAFSKQMPKFIVDTHKRHFPWDRPPLELWPRLPQSRGSRTSKGFLPTNKQIIDEYEAVYSKWLRDNIGEREAERFKAMKPFREFVMKNYKIVRSFGQHVLLQLENPLMNVQSE